MCWDVVLVMVELGIKLVTKKLLSLVNVHWSLILIPSKTFFHASWLKSHPNLTWSFIWTTKVEVGYCLFIWILNLGWTNVTRSKGSNSLCDRVDPWYSTFYEDWWVKDQVWVWTSEEWTARTEGHCTSPYYRGSL